MQPEPLADLIQLLRRLPGLGPRSARRLAYALLGRQNELLAPLIAALQSVRTELRLCHRCFSVDVCSPCRICADPFRSADTLCVVESLSHLYAIEATKAFRGRYFVLHGVLSAIDGVTPEKLRLPALVERLRSDNALTELIIATSSTLDGATTAHVIADLLAGMSRLSLSRPARGLPVGADLDFSDAESMVAAFQARTRF